MIGKKYRGESQYGEKVEGWLVRHPLGKVFLIVYKGWDEPRWVAVKEETLEEVPEVEEPKDITERIKTFDDACKWCVENGKREMLHTYSLIFNDLLNSESEITEEVDDIIAYLKLRIITCALNEGWEPTLDNMDERYDVYYDETAGCFDTRFNNGEICDKSCKLCFRRLYLAIYASTQFRDIYADFCGCGKGGEE